MSSENDLDELLSEIDDFVPETVVMREEKINYDLKYPCLVIEGLVLQDEFTFLVNRKSKTPYKVPLYVKLGNYIQEVGLIDFTLDTFLMLSRIHKYDLVLHKSPSENSKIDLGNPETFIKLLKI